MEINNNILTVLNVSTIKDQGTFSICFQGVKDTSRNKNLYCFIGGMSTFQIQVYHIFTTLQSFCVNCDSSTFVVGS